MTPVTVLHRNSRVRMAEREEQDAARAHLEQCHSLPDIVRDWWVEQDEPDLFAHEARMCEEFAAAVYVEPCDPCDFAVNYRRRAFLDSAECERDVDDMAAGAKEWPR